MFWAVYKYENQKIINVNFIIKKGILRVVGSEGKLQSNPSDMNIAAVDPGGIEFVPPRSKGIKSSPLRNQQHPPIVAKSFRSLTIPVPREEKVGKKERRVDSACLCEKNRSIAHRTHLDRNPTFATRGKKKE